MKGVTIENLVMTAGRPPRTRPILKGITLDVPPGSITGVAGESGSGKTMTGLSILGLHPANTRISGKIEYDDVNLVELPRKQLNRLRGNHIAMVFQDPTASLHPMMTIQTQLTDHLRFHQDLSKTRSRDRAQEVLEQVHVADPQLTLRKYPHQLSGGQLQRIAIASAIMCRPQVLIADEPTTALDVTVQAGILRLLRQLCDELDLAVLLVTHDFGVMSSVADTVVVMRAGEIVESGHRHQVITAPQHPYTRGLIESLPRSQLNVPSPIGLQAGGDDD